MNKITTESDFTARLETLRTTFINAQVNWDNIIGILFWKISRVETPVSSNSNYQMNRDILGGFFPVLEQYDDWTHRRIRPIVKVPKVILNNYGLFTNHPKDWVIGGISIRSLTNNSYPYIQVTFEPPLKEFKAALSENDQLFFLKERNSDEYIVLATSALVFNEDKFVAVSPSRYTVDKTHFTLDYTNFDPNIIYYGPPGTGKTREIQLNHLSGKDDSNSKFITFHQSYSYEEFIEGLKPQVIHGHEVIYENTNLREFIKYSFDTLLEDLSWEVLSQNIQETDSTINSNQYRGLRLPDFFGANNLLGKFDTPQTRETLSSAGTQRYFENPIASNTGDNLYLTTQWGDVSGDGLTYKNFQRFITKVSGGLYSSIQREGNFILTQQTELNSNVIYKILKGVFYDACESASRLAGYSSLQECIADTVEGRVQKMNRAISSNNVFVMCIDEINRANISSVFGDLITLIESKKRLGAPEEMSAILPYSKEKFGVPCNLQIIGTMNTADRSITLLDSALRRRFHFEEILPNPEVLHGVEIDGINISSLLKKLNKRIIYFIGKDQAIGHSYFIGLDKSTTPKKDLLSIFRNNIIPLLEEYFYNDIPKIRLVLGENNKSEDLSFYKFDEESDIEKLFGNVDEDIDQDIESSSYVKNDVLIELSISGEEAEINKDIFIKIYQ
jgi:hypothetical protein